LWVASGDQLPDYTELVLKFVADFGGEFSSPVHDDFRRARIADKPSLFEDVDNLVGSLGWDFGDLEPSGYGINHSEAMERGLIALLLRPYSVRTDEVYTESFPWNLFREFRWQMP
jgi:hypothetical protein